MTILALMSCEEDPVFRSQEEQLEIDLKAIDKYLEDNNIEAEIDPVYGLRYVIHEQGTGENPGRTNYINVAYEGRTLKGSENFDESDGVSFCLSRLIIGWQIGLQKIQEGGRMTMYVPSGYAYGPRGSGQSIGPNANLIFEIELKEIVSTTCPN